MKNIFLVFLLLAFVFSGCTSDSKFKEKLSNTLKNNPEILTEAIKENPVKILEALQAASIKAREEIGKNKQNEEQQALENSFNNPLQPEIRGTDAIRGEMNAPITLVTYSDFECPYCNKGHDVQKELMKEYGKNIRIVFKHLPLDFHKFALISAKYFEAIKNQSTDKAFKFHDYIFENQKELQKGESFLDGLVKQVGADLTKVKKDINSPAILKKIQQDQEEAKKFAIEGTPGFIINGIPVRGAYPAEYFKNIVSELKKRGKLSI